MSQPEIIISSRGGRKLLYNGYVYYRRDSKKDKIYWYCVKTDECKATAITLNTGNNVEIVKEGSHGHAPNQEQVEAEKVISNLKRIATDHPESTPAQILRTELPSVSSGVLSQLPDRENLKKRIRRQRRQDFPPDPKSIADLRDIPEQFRKTKVGDTFIIYDSLDDEDETEIRVIIFGTRRNLEILARSTAWFLDGTFKTSPNIFLQIFVVMGLIRKSSPGKDDVEIAVPLVYSLLPSKYQVSYETVVGEVKNACQRYEIDIIPPLRVLMDFEVAVKNALLAVFTNWIVQYCFFHLGQSFYRRIQSEGLQEQYNNPNDRSLKEYAHMILSLAFVPTADVEQAFEKIFDDIPEELVPIARYFEENYIVGRRARGRRRAVPPRYPASLWNTYEATLRDQHRTNNISEGWHNKFQLMVGKNHHSLYYLLKEFLKEQADTETILRQLDLGQAVKAAPKKKWMQSKTRMRNIVSQYEDYKEKDEILQYLRLLGHNISL